MPLKEQSTNTHNQPHRTQHHPGPARASVPGRRVMAGDAGAVAEHSQAGQKHDRPDVGGSSAVEPGLGATTAAAYPEAKRHRPTGPPDELSHASCPRERTGQERWRSMGRPARNTAGRLRPCITLITTRNPPTIRSGRSSADSISVKPPRLTSTSPPTVTHRSRRRRARRAVWRSPRDGVLTRPSSAADRQGAKPQDQPPPVASRTRCQKPSPCHWIRRSPGRPSGAPCHFTLAKGDQWGVGPPAAGHAPAISVPGPPHRCWPPPQAAASAPPKPPPNTPTGAYPAGKAALAGMQGPGWLPRLNPWSAAFAEKVLAGSPPGAPPP